MNLFALLLATHPFFSVFIRGWPTEFLENHVVWGYFLIPVPRLLHVQRTRGSALECTETSSLPGCTSWQSLQTKKCSSISIEKGRNQGSNAGTFLPDVWLQHQASCEKVLTSAQRGFCPLTRRGTRPDQAVKAAACFVYSANRSTLKSPVEPSLQ